MSNGAISQAELDNLFGVGGGLEELPELYPKGSHVWIVKDSTYGAVCGRRCWSYIEAQNLITEAKKHYPNHTFEIKQLR